MVQNCTPAPVRGTGANRTLNGVRDVAGPSSADPSSPGSNRAGHVATQARPWQRFVAIGDSFTEGLNDELDANGRHRGWADRVACALAEREASLQYANLAIRGRLASHVHAEQVPIALGLQPDLVSLAVGVNDALRRHFNVSATATHIEQSVRQLRSANIDVLLFAFGDPARRSSVMGLIRDRLLAMNSATRAIARHYGCYLVDFWGVSVFDEDELWSADRLHLSPTGHGVAAAAALQALGLGDDAWRTPHPVAAPRLPQRAAANIHWAGTHLGPWLARRARGTSSGDGVLPKRPILQPVSHRSTS